MVCLELIRKLIGQ